MNLPKLSRRKKKTWPRISYATLQPKPLSPHVDLPFCQGCGRASNSKKPKSSSPARYKEPGPWGADRTCQITLKADRVCNREPRGFQCSAGSLSLSLCSDIHHSPKTNGSEESSSNRSSLQEYLMPLSLYILYVNLPKIKNSWEIWKYYKNHLSSLSPPGEGFMYYIWNGTLDFSLWGTMSSTIFLATLTSSFVYLPQAESEVIKY